MVWEELMAPHYVLLYASIITVKLAGTIIKSCTIY